LNIIHLRGAITTSGKEFRISTEFHTTHNTGVVHGVAKVNINHLRNLFVKAGKKKEGKKKGTDQIAIEFIKKRKKGKRKRQKEN
jgi:hypothetical protein